MTQEEQSCELAAFTFETVIDILSPYDDIAPFVEKMFNHLNPDDLKTAEVFCATFLSYSQAEQTERDAAQDFVRRIDRDSTQAARDNDDV